MLRLRSRLRVGFAPLLLLAISIGADALGNFDSEKSSWIRRDDDISFIRSKRDSEIPIPEKKVQSKSKAYQACVGPGSKPGHCKHVSNCNDDTLRSSFAKSMEYMCVIEKQFVGVCCPDDSANNDENDVLPVRGLAGSLPVVATEGDDDAMEVPDADVDNKNRSSRAHRGCGINLRDQSRVTGGKPANAREWPWVAALTHWTEQFGWDPFCGGVLITDRHILTAAHCVHRLKPKDFRIRLGEYDLTTPNETRAIEFKVVEIRIHRKYQATTYKHDIAIVKINRPTVFSTYIWPICLPPVGANFENKQATVIGWGQQKFAGTPSSVLKEVTIPIWPQDKCASKFTAEITSNHICAGAYEGNGDACQGDSGGPLLHQLSNGRWVSVGIVSWGIGCGEPDRPGIYTRVNAYLDWIFANAVF